MEFVNHAFMTNEMVSESQKINCSPVSEAIPNYEME